jgi:hypothetical protein
MLLHYNDEQAEPPGDDAALLDAWLTEMKGRGVLLHGQRLRSTAYATTVRNPSGEILVADGPFAETKEQMAGYDVIDCADLDEAIEIAAKHPTTRFGTIEIRPFLEP